MLYINRLQEASFTSRDLHHLPLILGNMSISIFVEKLCRHVSFLEPPPQLVPSLREDNGDDHAIEAEGLTEDEDEDHADEDFLLLSVGADTSVTDDTDSESSCKGRETASQA